MRHESKRLNAIKGYNDKTNLRWISGSLSLISTIIYVVEYTSVYFHTVISAIKKDNFMNTSKI